MAIYQESTRDATTLGLRALVISCSSADGRREKEHLKSQGVTVIEAANGALALELSLCHEFDVILMDLTALNGTAEETIRQLKGAAPFTPVILLDGSKPLNGLDQHVYNHLQRPVAAAALFHSVRNAAAHRQRLLENRGLANRNMSTAAPGDPSPRETKASRSESTAPSPVLIGESKSMRDILRKINEVAQTEMTVLLQGESGTGKEVVARLLHEKSSRRTEGAFVKINCPAVPETLFESELFGHEAGAFTGAQRRKPGRLEMAHRGTVFFDEVSSMSPAMQAKVLEAIEYKQFTRVGGTNSIKVDARIVAATNAPLPDLIAKGEFRADLFYRLKQFVIALPPLRERKEDIPLLCNYFLDVYSRKQGARYSQLQPGQIAQLVNYEWPGNVRELQSVIACYVLNGELDVHVSNCGADGEPAGGASETGQLDKVEANTIAAALQEARWNRREAAKKLGISYSALRRRMAKYRLP